jgi:hypothetical protein
MDEDEELVVALVDVEEGGGNWNVLLVLFPVVVVGEDVKEDDDELVVCPTELLPWVASKAA